MAAPEGNQFWKLAPSTGRKKIYSTKEELLTDCYEYFEVTEQRNDWNQQEWVGKDGDEVKRNIRVPFTKTGLCVFLGIDLQTWDNYGSKEGYEEFFGIVTHVNAIIYTQKFEGAATGHFNQSIIAMELGLKSKTEGEIKGDITNRIIVEDAQYPE